MKGDKEVIRYLNARLKDELTVVNQYFFHARVYSHWGFKYIGDHRYKESIGKMKHVDRLIERILMSDGLLGLQDLGRVFIGQGMKEIIEYDLKLERAIHGTVVEGIAYCESVKGYASREILVDILDDIGEYTDWLGTQSGLIDRVDIQNYLQSQVEPEGE